MKKYIAKIGPLNAEKIACSPHGTATFTEDEEQDTLHIMIEMFDTPANIEHQQHFHGFPDGKATMDNDLNGDGFVDLPETELVLGTTMVPFNINVVKYGPHVTLPIAVGKIEKANN